MLAFFVFDFTITALLRGVSNKSLFLEYTVRIIFTGSSNCAHTVVLHFIYGTRS